jgi:hypothetical protein
MSGSGTNSDDIEDDLRPEYDFDFSKAVRGKHYEAYRRSTNVVVLDPDVVAAFQNSEAVNAALRSMLQFAERTAELTAEAPDEPR